jgi:hypothetical protein
MPIQLPHKLALQVRVYCRQCRAWWFFLVRGRGKFINIFIWGWLYYIFWWLIFAQIAHAGGLKMD